MALFSFFQGGLPLSYVQMMDAPHRWRVKKEYEKISSQRYSLFSETTGLDLRTFQVCNRHADTVGSSTLRSPCHAQGGWC